MSISSCTLTRDAIRQPVVADVSGTAAADVDQRGERKALDILFVHFVVDFSYKYNNLPVNIRRKVQNRTNRTSLADTALFRRFAKGELCIEKL